MEDIPAAQNQRLCLKAWLIFFLIFGVSLRLLRYALKLPIWVDEGFLGVNILERSFHQLLKPMEYIQVAPLGFIWAERAMFQAFGMSEYVMRLIPTLAGIAALILFAFWTRKILEPLAATLATAVLAVSDLAVRHAVELKPYGVDLLVGIVLLYPATLFLKDRQTRRLVFLILITPLAIFVSLPSVFIAAGIVATLCFDFPRMAARQRILVLILGAVLCTTFGVLVWRFIGAQFAGSGPSQQICWVFPPYNPPQFFLWFVQTHSGNFFGYPLDFTAPGSGASFLLMVIGAMVLFRTGRARLGLLVISPFVMTFIAALLRRYPYGDSPRVGQHLVGPICLLIGLGSAYVIRLFARRERALQITCLVIFILLINIGLAGPGALLIAPSHEMKRDFAVRKFILDQLHGLPPRTTVAVLEKPDESDILSRWYVHEGGRRILWNVPISELSLLAQGPLLIVSSRIDLTGLQQQIAAEMGHAPDRSEQYVVPMEVGYATYFYANVESLPRAAGAMSAP